MRLRPNKNACEHCKKAVYKLECANCGKELEHEPQFICIGKDEEETIHYCMECGAVAER